MLTPEKARAQIAIIRQRTSKPLNVNFFCYTPVAADAAAEAKWRIVLSSATTVQEARWLEANGADVIIAQGNEAGGHRGMFLTDKVDQQPGTFALDARRRLKQMSA